MRFTRWKVIGFLAVVLVFTFGMLFAVPTEAKLLFGPNLYIKEGFYLGGMVLYHTIGGDFDGETMLTISDEVFYVPKVEGNYGWGIVVGLRDPRFEAGLGFFGSTHDVSFFETEGEADYLHLDLNVKPNFLIADRPIQPYLLLGVGIGSLYVKDGSATTNDIGDASFRGIGLNVGGGIGYYFHPKVSISGGVLYRLMVYTSVTGVTETPRDLADRLGGSGVNFNIGIAYTF